VICHVPVSSVFVPPSSRRLLPSSLCPSSCSCHRPERDECAPMSCSQHRPPRSSLPQRLLTPSSHDQRCHCRASRRSWRRLPLTSSTLPLPPSRSFFLPASHTSLGWAEAERMHGVPGLPHFCVQAGTRSSCAAESCRAPSFLCMSHFSYLRHASCLIAGFVLSLRLSLIHLSPSSSSAERERLTSSFTDVQTSNYK
jgi:hypothetical protein